MIKLETSSGAFFINPTPAQIQEAVLGVANYNIWSIRAKKGRGDYLWLVKQSHSQTTITYHVPGRWAFQARECIALTQADIEELLVRYTTTEISNLENHLVALAPSPCPTKLEYILRRASTWLIIIALAAVVFLTSPDASHNQLVIMSSMGVLSLSFIGLALGWGLQARRVADVSGALYIKRAAVAILAFVFVSFFVYMVINALSRAA